MNKKRVFIVKTLMLLLPVFTLPSQSVGIESQSEIKTESSQLNFESADKQLIDAIKKGNIRQAKDAILKGANPNMKLKTGDEVIFLAAMSLDHRFLELLLKHGANQNVYNENRKRHLIFEVLSPRRHQHLKTLLNFNPDVNVLDGSDYNTLMYSATLSNYLAMKLLLERGAGADMDACNIMKLTEILQLNYSLECKNSPCTKLKSVMKELGISEN